VLPQSVICKSHLWLLLLPQCSNGALFLVVITTVTTAFLLNPAVKAFWGRGIRTPLIQVLAPDGDEWSVHAPVATLPGHPSLSDPMRLCGRGVVAKRKIRDQLGISFGLAPRRQSLYFLQKQ
jgi:hypothetical protein